MLFGKTMYGFIIAGFIITFVLFSLIENDAREKIKHELLNDQKIHGETMTKHNSHLISNEFDIILEKQKKLALYVQHNSHDPSIDVSEFALDTYSEIESRMDIFALSILDNENVIKIRVKDGELTEEFVGQDTSEQKFVKEFNEKKKPLISDVFLGLDNYPRIASTYPVFDEYDKLTGSIVVIINPSSFFQKFDDTYGLSSDVLTIIDKEQQIVKHSVPELIGENVFEKKIQSQLNIEDSDNEIIELMRKSFSGENVFFISQFDGNEKLTFMQPIFLNEEQIFTIILSIPLEKILSKPQSILFNAETAVFILIGTTGFITLISFYFIQNQYLKREKLQKFSIIGELSSRISHDIRNPLSNISLAVKLLQNNKNLELDDNSKDKFQIISKNLDRISHQVNDVLNFVKIQQLEKTRGSLNSCLSESIESMNIPKNIKMNLPSEKLEIYADFFQIQIVFKNLINNAIQSIDKQEGSITIRFKENSAHVIIEIEDTGLGFHGISPSKIFEPLTTTKLTGTGLGLLSCKQIIENHDGAISVKTNPTLFTISLPKK
jgi:two-component system sensor histidine kinase HydH